jgi:hypothetical protein
MRRGAVFGSSLAIASLIASVHGQEHHWPTDDEQDRAGQPYKDCMHAEAERIDDGKADIGIVGMKVAEACQVHFDQMIDEIGRSLSADERKVLWQSQFNMRAGFGAAEVGRVRLERHSKPQP